MEPITKPRIKICCISSVEEMRLVVRCGASAVGLVSAMPSGPGVISEEEIARIAAAVPPGVGSFLLTSVQNAASIIAQQRRCRTNTLQLVDRLEVGTYEEIREALPGIKIVQVIHIVDESSLEEAAAIAPQVDALLLDSGNQSLAIKELGGTGRVHDWAISRRIREQVDVPLYLAGGLNAGNVQEAIAFVRPFGLDLCSSVRTDGRLDEIKLARLFAAINGVAE
ncbi:MAG TPA: phosphoribosylanthranilate isomerase [Ktedonobacterales bacterium]|nr:phosphoribosylanthranilate isomerase [Ktedonobacterales bacterium]